MNIANIVKSRFYGRSFDGEEAMFNMYWFCGQLGSSTAPAEELALRLEVLWSETMLDLMVDDAVFEGIEVQNLNNVIEYYNNIFPDAKEGNIVDVPANARLTYLFKKVRPYPPLKNGYLNTWGLGRFQIEGNGAPSSLALPLLAMATLITTPVITATSYGYTPVVLRNQNELPPVPTQAWTINQAAFVRVGTRRSRNSE